MKKFIQLVHRLINKIAIYFYDEHTMANFFRRTQDIKIGNNCRIIGKRPHMFGSEPYLVEIGDDVTIADDVKFITHDGGLRILRSKTENLNVFGRIIIRDNCFIGANSILMPNVTIGPNSVVGAGSIVTKNVPPNTVVAGVPAKVIMSVDEYHQKALAKGLLLSSYNKQERKQRILEHLDKQ